MLCDRKISPLSPHVSIFSPMFHYNEIGPLQVDPSLLHIIPRVGFSTIFALCFTCKDRWWELISEWTLYMVLGFSLLAHDVLSVFHLGMQLIEKCQVWWVHGGWILDCVHLIVLYLPLLYRWSPLSLTHIRSLLIFNHYGHSPPLDSSLPKDSPPRCHFPWHYAFL